jgi:hypothetical protein
MLMGTLCFFNNTSLLIYQEKKYHLHAKSQYLYMVDFKFFFFVKIVVGSLCFLSANISGSHNQDIDSKHWSPCIYIFDTNRPRQNSSTHGEFHCSTVRF